MVQTNDPCSVCKCFFNLPFHYMLFTVDKQAVIWRITKHGGNVKINNGFYLIESWWHLSAYSELTGNTSGSQLIHIRLMCLKEKVMLRKWQADLFIICHLTLGG